MSLIGIINESGKEVYYWKDIRAVADVKLMQSSNDALVDCGVTFEV